MRRFSLRAALLPPAPLRAGRLAARRRAARRRPSARRRAPRRPAGHRAKACRSWRTPPRSLPPRLALRWTSRPPRPSASTKASTGARFPQRPALGVASFRHLSSLLAPPTLSQGGVRQEVGGAVRAERPQPPPGHLRRRRAGGGREAVGRKGPRAGPQGCVLPYRRRRRAPDAPAAQSATSPAPASRARWSARPRSGRAAPRPRLARRRASRGAASRRRLRRSRMRSPRRRRASAPSAPRLLQLSRLLRSASPLLRHRRPSWMRRRRRRCR